MQLNGQQRKLFHKSLLSAFPSTSKLRQMLSFELDENLDAIAMGDNYSDTVFKLIKWAESEGKVRKLLNAARSSNSGNPELRSFEEQMRDKFDENPTSEINVYSSKVKYLYHYKFRAECEHDVNELIKILNPNIKEITKTKQAPFPDVDVKMCAYLSLKEIQAAIKDIEDGHVMLETLELIHDYTGERKYFFETTNYPKIEEDDLSSERGVDYTHLRDLLKAGNWKEADRETLAVMLNFAGREKEGWLDSDSIEKFPCTDLRTIDQLWVKYSNGHFGFSVQKLIWESLGGQANASYKTFCKFGDRVGWRVKENWIDNIYNNSTLLGYLPYEPIVSLEGVRVSIHMTEQFGGSYSRAKKAASDILKQPCSTGDSGLGVVGILFSRVETCKLPHLKLLEVYKDL